MKQINTNDVSTIIASDLSTTVFLHKTNNFVPQWAGKMGHFYMIYDLRVNNLYVMVPFWDVVMETIDQILKNLQNDKNHYSHGTELEQYMQEERRN